MKSNGGEVIIIALLGIIGISLCFIGDQLDQIIELLK